MPIERTTVQHFGDYLMGAWWFVVLALLFVCIWAHSGPVALVVMVLACGGAAIEMERG